MHVDPVTLYRLYDDSHNHRYLCLTVKRGACNGT